MTPVEDMTDAEIIGAVRSGRLALVPVEANGYAVIGQIAADDCEGVNGLLIRLSQDECRFVAPQVLK